MLESLLNGNREQFSISKSFFSRMRLHHTAVDLWKLKLRISLGSFGAGSIELPFIHFYASQIELRRIALAIVFTVYSENLSEYFLCEGQNLIKGVKITVAKPPGYKNVNIPKYFRYQKARKILHRYPWYPSSLKWDPLTELPSFGLSGVPGEKINLQADNFLDRSKPHVISISGYPSAMMRLARTLFTYANSIEPIENLVFEIEGGFRGVGYFSYPASFEICPSVN